MLSHYILNLYLLVYKHRCSLSFQIVRSFYFNLKIIWIIRKLIMMNMSACIFVKYVCLTIGYQLKRTCYFAIELSYANVELKSGNFNGKVYMASFVFLYPIHSMFTTTDLSINTICTPLRWHCM